jgi:hypothetical protein
MSQVESTDQPARGGSRFPFRVVDSALIIAIVIAVLNYAGWTYRQAYLQRFSIDPASLDNSSVAIAVDGVGAIGTTFFAWIAASVFLLVSGLCMWALVWWVERRRGSSGPLADHTAVMMGQAGGIAFCAPVCNCGRLHRRQMGRRRSHCERSTRGGLDLSSGARGHPRCSHSAGEQYHSAAHQDRHTPDPDDRYPPHRWAVV